MGYSIRLAVTEDAAQIEAIYAHYVLTSSCTAQRDVDPPGTREAWLSNRSAQHPVTVAIDDEDGSIAAWGSLNEFKNRWGYRFTTESSVYVREDKHRQGLGKRIVQDLIERARANGFHTIIAGITSEQEPSIQLHAVLGFIEVARMEETIHKFNRWMALIYMQRKL